MSDIINAPLLFLAREVSPESKLSSHTHLPRQPNAAAGPCKKARPRPQRHVFPHEAEIEEET